jgi:excisionase family DNA binding protein
MTIEQRPDRYVHAGGQVVIVPARVAAWLDSHGLNKFRIQYRGVDPEIDAVLVGLRIAALAWRGTATGTVDAPKPILSPEWLSTSEAADLAGLTSRGIRKAITDHRLEATKVGHCWRISRENLEHYRAATAA